MSTDSDCGMCLFSLTGDHRVLHVLTHAFPTRRSSDLRADQARVEAGEELQRAHRVLAAHAQAGALVVAEEQALVLAQRVLDLAVARQRGVVVDAQAGGGLELGLVVVADAAFGHQPRGLVGEAVATFAGARFGVLTGAMHGDLPAEAWANSTQRPMDVRSEEHT